MDFTREPIIETVITPREGYRLVVRSSKGAGSEEHFVDALEVVSFGSGIFFRSLERPKPFIVPVADYEVLEVREPRMVLKTPGEHGAKVPTQRLKAVDPQKAEAISVPQEQAATTATASTEAKPERTAERNDRRRDRRRGFRRRRGGKDEAGTLEGTGVDTPLEEGQIQADEGLPISADRVEKESRVPSSTPMLSSILPPPTMLIRDDLKRLREDYKGAFYINDENDEKDDQVDVDDDASLASLGTPSDEEITFRESSFAASEEDVPLTQSGDAGVSQESSFRPEEEIKEEANSSSSQDSQ